MWFEINGFDMTDYVQYDSVEFSSKINDPMPEFSFELYDEGSQIDLEFGMEIIVHDENTPPLAFGDIVVAALAPPSRNILQKAAYFLADNPAWSTTGTLASLIVRTIGSITMTFNNSALGSGLLQQTTLAGYCKPNQRYMFSIYVTMTTQLVNARAVIRMEFLDQSNSVLSTISDTHVPASVGVEERINIQGVAPANATYIRVSMGGETTIGGNNSGALRLATTQLEPMTFADRGVTYPTPDCNFNQATCRRLPDDTISRATRIYAGYIESLDIQYDGPNRRYTVTVAPAARIMESGTLISAVFENEEDNDLLNFIISTWFNGRISALEAPNLILPATVVYGITITISFTDMTLREVLNSLADQSGYTFFIDPYYQLYYHPVYYLVASFALSDNPDDISSFAYEDYRLRRDGSQVKRRVKVIGANPEGPAITQTWIGDAIGTVFFLNKIPASLNKLTTNGNPVNVGIKGINTYAQGYTALVDAPNKIIVWNSPPANGATTIVEYTFQNPVVSVTEKRDSGGVIAAAYVTPTFDAKVNDSNLASLTATTARGLAEITKFGEPRITVTCKATRYIAPGTAVDFTSTLDGIIDRPLIVQSVSGRFLGAGISEYSYTLGEYNPDIIDFLRNTNKSMNRSNAIGNVTTSLSTGLAASETFAWSESVTLTENP